MTCVIIVSTRVAHDENDDNGTIIVMMLTSASQESFLPASTILKQGLLRLRVTSLRGWMTDFAYLVRAMLN